MENKEKRSLKGKIVSFFLPKGIEVDRLRYRPNKFGYSFAFLGCLLLCLGFAIAYSGTGINDDPILLFGKETTSGRWTGIDVLINILLLLFRLTSALRRKNYSLKGSFMAFVRGIRNILRVFFFPLSLLKAGIRSKGIYAGVRICYVLCGCFLLLSSLLTFFKGSTLHKYLKTVKPIENEKGD